MLITPNLKISNKSIDVLEITACNELSKKDKHLNSHNLAININKTCLISFKTNVNNNLVELNCY